MYSESGEEEKKIKVWKNEAGKRVCDVNDDHTAVIIIQKGYITRVTANKDGTLKIENLPYKEAS